jgi:hypothetical protein
MMQPDPVPCTGCTPAVENVSCNVLDKVRGETENFVEPRKRPTAPLKVVIKRVSTLPFFV